MELSKSAPKLAFAAVAAMAVGLAACSGSTTKNATETVARACSPPRPAWLAHGPLDAGLMPPAMRVSLDRNGAIYWNGHRTTLPRLREYLSIIVTMEPQPVTFLDTEMGTPCALVDQVREEMERHLHCAAHGFCAEGIWEVWEETPIPPGTPVS